MTDFFISYTGVDQVWAEWIAWTLESAGYTTKIQAWDFRPGGNFVVEMHRAAAGAERTIAVLSPEYQRSLYAMAEWAAAFVADPDGTKGKLVPVLVRETNLDGLLSPVIHIKLLELGEAAAREKLLQGLVPGRAKPESVRFPGTRPFPGLPAAPPNPAEAKATLEALPLDEVPKPGPLPVGSRMPHAPNPLFVGREEDLKTLARQLKAGETSAVGQVETAVATGLGGIGKTQLASELVHRYGRYFAGGTFWMGFADGNTVPIEVADCGRGLGLSSSYDALTLEQQVRLVEEAWRSPLPRLLVFDNCEDENLLRRWRPPSGGSRVLVTSRKAEWDLTLGVKTVPLTTLPRPASIELLRHFRPEVSDKEPALDRIAEELGDLPLALHLAGSFLHRYRAAPFGEPEAYLEALRQKELLEHPSLKGHGSGALPTGHEGHVGRTFALSFERLDPTSDVDSLAIKLLARAAWFAPGDPIPRSLLLTAADTNLDDLTGALLAEDALHRLTDLGLIELTGKAAPIMHRLVAAWARGVAEADEVQIIVEKSVIEAAERLNEARNPVLLLPWQPHLRAVTDRARARQDQLAARLCDKLGVHLWQAGDYSGARPFLEEAVKIHTQVLGAEHPDTASSLNNLGRVLYSQGIYVEARLCFEQALAMREKSYGTEHPDTADSINDLGILLFRLGDFQGAISNYQRALEIRKKVLGMEHPDTAKSLASIGTLLGEQGDYKGARVYFEQAIAIHEKTSRLAHPDTAVTFSNFAQILRDQRDYSGARAYLERSVAVVEKAFGPEHPDTTRVLSNLGSILQLQGDYESALNYCERALTGDEKILGPEHPDTALSLANLGSLYFSRGNMPKARRYLERALSVYKARLGPEHPSTREVRRRLGLLPGNRQLKKSRSKRFDR